MNCIFYVRLNTTYMKTLAGILLALFTLTASAQTEAEQAIRQTIDRFFEGYHARDTSLMGAVLGENVLLQTIGRNPEGKPLLRSEAMDDFIASIAAIPDTVQIQEKLLDYKIRIDGDMANAWTPYEFFLRGEFHHCGVNSFQLFHDGEAWKIIYIIDTRRKEGCREQ